MSEEVVEVALRRGKLDDACMVLIRDDRKHEFVEVLLTKSESEEFATHRARICPHCGGELRFLSVVGRDYCFNCKKYNYIN